VNFATRKAIYEQIEEQRSTKVLAYITGDRRGLETQIHSDCIDLFVDLLDQIGPTQKISLILHTNGGQTLAAWRLVNLLRIYCDELEILIPMKALSAGTLICIGADTLVMTKQAALGPIDPSVNNPLNPQVTMGSQPMGVVPVSVEAVLGYLSAAKDELKIKSEGHLTNILLGLASQVHPLVLGEIFRSRAQIRFLAGKLLPRQIKDKDNIKKIIEFLCAESGSHDYTINRREARELGLNVEVPSDNLYNLLRAIHLSYGKEMELLEPYNPQVILGVNPTASYMFVRGLVEATLGSCYRFISEGTLTKSMMPGPLGPQEAITDQRTFEGWKKLQ
jgi:Serine dehydrogenase proteinase